MLGYDANMATRIPKPSSDEPDFIPEGPELDALIKAKVAQALADPRPPVPLEEAIARVHARIDAAA
jgi:hypothetical protein